MASDELYLHEEVLLLALRDEEGTVPLGSMYPHAAAGAILAELMLRGCIAIEGEKKLVVATDSTPLDAPLLDETLDRIGSEKKPTTLEKWVARLARTDDLKGRIARHLCERGILRAEEDKVLLIFTREIYPEVDPEPEEWVIERLREAIFTDREVDPRTAILVSLAEGTGLLGSVFGRKELKSRKMRIEQLTSGEVIGGAAGAVVQEMQTMVAVMAAITASTAAASAASCAASSATC